MHYRFYSLFLTKRRFQGLGLLAAFLLIMALVPPNLPVAHGSAQIQPQLQQLLSQRPTDLVSIIVQKQAGNSGQELEGAVTQLGGTVTKDLHIINAFAANLPAGKVSELAELGGVRWISLDSPLIKPSTTWNCSDCVNPDKLVNTYDKDVRADQVWNKLSAGGDQQAWLQGQGVGVAVVDSGISTNMDFQTNGTYRVVKSVKFNSTTSLLGDSFGHGTHIAGIIGGDGSNSNGSYVGIAPKANLISVKVSDDTGMSTASDLVNGLQWINDNRTLYNIKVVNISLNSAVSQSYNTDPLCAAAEILWFNGIVVVVSAGNNGSTGLYPPANDPFVITVGAVDDKGTVADASGNFSVSDDTVTSFSAYGRDETGNNKPDLVAPGKNIISVLSSRSSMLYLSHLTNLVGFSYFKMSGTSMAAPVVTGAVALLLQSEPNLNPDQVKYRLKATALQNTPRGSWDTRARWANYDATTAGAGYLDVYAAITQKTIVNTANTGLPASRMLWSGSNPVSWGSVNWSSVNWSSVNWSSVNWSSVNWSSVNWSSDYWE